MADTKAPRGQQPLPRKPEPRLPHSPVNPLDAEDLGAAPAGFAAAPVNARKSHGFSGTAPLPRAWRWVGWYWCCW